MVARHDDRGEDMQDSAIGQAAAMLVAVRQGGPRIAGLGAVAPTDQAGAWAVQKEVLARLGARIGGWKCAAPPGKPTSGAMLDAAGIRPGPATWRVPQGQRIGLETEIAFRFGRALPPRGTPYSPAEVLDAVEAAFPVIELVESRYEGYTKVSPEELMADSISHGGLVCGADVPGWRDMDLAGLTVRQSYGGEVQVEKAGGNPSGDPLTPTVWLANALHGAGLQIEAGHVVTTGSCTGLIWVKPGARATGSFLGFGEVSVDLA
jgi:2-keto-4-pentenoate hydratase